MDKIDALLEEAIAKNDAGDFRAAMCNLYEAEGLMRARMDEVFGGPGMHFAKSVQLNKAAGVELWA